MQKQKKNLFYRKSIRYNAPLNLDTSHDSKLESGIRDDTVDDRKNFLAFVRRRSKLSLQDPNTRRMFNAFCNRMKMLIVPHTMNKDVAEDWEKDGNDSSRTPETGRYLFVKTSKIYFLIELALFLINVLMIWFVSVQCVYDTNDRDNSVLPVLWQIMAVLDIIVTVNTTRIKDGREVRDRCGIFQMYIRGQMFVDVLCIVCVVMLTALDEDARNIVYMILMAVLFVKAIAKYSNIKPFLDHNFPKQHLTLVTSFAFLIAMGHIFGLVMYLVGANANTQKNWIIASKLKNQEWDTRYIFSLYWAVTTMVTVGYGDITPQNKYQAIVVMIIEILGASIFGYMINIIGMTLALLKERNEALEAELTITEKISKCFNLEDDLTYRIKSFLRNNHKVDASFSLGEQTKLIQKLNPVLKQQLLEQTNTKVIKKSIFFLMYFSKNLQNKLSMKLSKKIFQPCEPIAKVHGEQSLYIINKGSIDLSVFRYHKSRVFSKKVRVISSVPTLSYGISLNVYGYTELIIGRQVNINATSTVFTIAYQLKKKDFQQALSTSMRDYQTICELRQRFFAKGILETVQAPQLADTRQHYYPHLYFLLRKNRVHSPQPRETQASRDTPKFKSLLLISLTDQRTVRENTLLESLKFRKNSDGVVIEEKTLTLQDYLKDFECSKNYQKYLVNSNMSHVLKKYQKCMSKKQIEKSEASSKSSSKTSIKSSSKSSSKALSIQQ